MLFGRRRVGPRHGHLFAELRIESGRCGPCGPLGSKRVSTGTVAERPLLWPLVAERVGPAGSALPTVGRCRLGGELTLVFEFGVGLGFGLKLKLQLILELVCSASVNMKDKSIK